MQSEGDAASVDVLREEEEEDEHSGLSSDEDDAFDALFEPTATVDLAAVAAAETRQVVMILKLVFEFLPLRDLKASNAVCKSHMASLLCVRPVMVYRDHRGVKNTVFRRRYRFCSSFERSSLSHARVLRRDLSLGRFLCRGGYKRRVQGVVRTQASV